MSAKHTFTPGPWALMPPESGVEYLRIRGTQLGRRFKVCNVHAPASNFPGEADESQANARLISAAPELLEALQAMVEVHGVTQAYADKHLEIPQSWVDLSNMARKAIAKATGGEQ